ncbi:hypothetical protein BGZ88_006451, partial [Linnemannia elongata]
MGPTTIAYGGPSSPLEIPELLSLIFLFLKTESAIDTGFNAYDNKTTLLLDALEHKKTQLVDTHSSSAPASEVASPVPYIQELELQGRFNLRDRPKETSRGGELEESYSEKKIEDLDNGDVDYWPGLRQLALYQECSFGQNCEQEVLRVGSTNDDKLRFWSKLMDSV